MSLDRLLSLAASEKDAIDHVFGAVDLVLDGVLGTGDPKTKDAPKDPDAEHAEEQVALVDCDRILIVRNTRTEVLEYDVEARAKSIEQEGQLQPILLRPLARPPRTGERYELVFGETRLRAMRLLGRKAIKSLIREMSDAQVEDAKWAENAERKALTHYEVYAEIARRWEARTHSSKCASEEEIAKRLAVPLLTVKQAVRVHEQVAPEVIAEFAASPTDESTWRRLIDLSRHCMLTAGMSSHRQREWWSARIVAEDAELEYVASDGGRGMKRRPFPSDIRAVIERIERDHVLEIGGKVRRLMYSEEQTALEILKWCAGPEKQKKPVNLDGAAPAEKKPEGLFEAMRAVLK
jgi:ParB family chromosome partitioning protein